MEEKVKLSPPWCTYVNELKAMFQNDPYVTIQYNDEAKEVKLFVAKVDKAEALAKILKEEQKFGGTTLKITVVPPNDEARDILDEFDDAFRYNDAVGKILPIESPFGLFRYVGFANKVVQFYNDQLDDPSGNKSMLLQEIARDIFKDELTVNYYTVEKES